jgi:nucleotide-binding universal stress UspA family protein
VLARARALLGDRVDGEDVIGRGHIGQRVIEHAIHVGADIIVLAARGQTHGTGLLGTSTADHVLSNAHCGVLVATSRVATRAIAPAWTYACSTS